MAWLGQQQQYSLLWFFYSCVMLHFDLHAFIFNLLFMDNLICLLKILSMYELSRCIKTLVADQRMGKIQRGSLNHIS